MKRFLLPICCCTLAACSPLKSSPREEKHQLELTLQELKTQIDEQKRDLYCFQTELKILDGRIKYYEQTLSNLKNQELDPHWTTLKKLSEQLQDLEQKFSTFEETGREKSETFKHLSHHANETTAALVQFKKRILEIEEQKSSQEIAKLKRIDGLQKSLAYKVCSGDSLEKIARMHQTTPKRIREANHLDGDLIVVGQELSIPQGAATGRGSAP